MEPKLKLKIEIWPVTKPQPYGKNPRKPSDRAVAKVAASLQEFGWRQPIVVDKDGVIVAGHKRREAAISLGLTEVPVHVADLTPAQAKAYRLMDNRSQDDSEWDEELLASEIGDLAALDIDLKLTGFEQREINQFLAAAGESAGSGDPDEVTEPPAVPVSVPGDLWLCGAHRVLCGDSTSADAVARLLEGQKAPLLMVTDPPYGISLDSEWRDRAGLNGCGPAEASYMKKKRTKGHTETTISGDTRADWSEAFALVPSIQVAYVWHASVFTHEVLDGLLRIGFLYPQQIIWNKGRVVLTRTRTHYWYQHEPCWYVRKKCAPWFGVPGENSTVWDSPSPKFIMGGSDEVKVDHPTQKPAALMVKSILNHTMPGEPVFEPFLGSGTTLIAAQMTARCCFGIELSPNYVDVIVRRWQDFSSQQATLAGSDRTFNEVSAERQKHVA